MEANSHHRLVAPHHFASFGCLFCHYKLKYCGKPVGCLHYKTRAIFRKIANRAHYFAASEKDLPGLQNLRTQCSSAIIHGLVDRL
jgi:DNA polymerase III epsilon subunit-like protein